MTIIELLIKKASGEKTPKKFKYDNLTFIENEYGRYEDEDGDNLTRSINWDYSNLNDEIEIIEEDKKIEKIDLSQWAEITYSENWELLTGDFNMNCTLFVNKINEIIDHINKGEDK